MNILHIVRRYGQVGGMERYVWKLVHEQVAMGHRVVVLCERCHEPAPSAVTVHQLGEIMPRPRWLSLLRFGWRVARWLKANPHPDFIVHSHERLDVHDVTTFHCPPFANVMEKPLWKRLSLRIAMQRYLEWRELDSARKIIPNSSLTRSQLIHYYPQFQHKLGAPIEPGAEAMQPPQPWSASPSDGGVIAFVGKEWKRKGLPLAIRIAADLRKTRPLLELWVIGPAPREVQHLFREWNGGYRLLGWCKPEDYLGQVNALLHPAMAEPYGMVISEAMAARIPVVVSDRCGAATEINADSGAVLSPHAPLQAWSAALDAQLQRASPPAACLHTWQQTACEYETIYRSLVRNDNSAQAESTPVPEDRPGKPALANWKLIARL